jgi:excisionase family DNA binding protein
VNTPLLKAAEVAKRLAISKAQVYRMAEQGAIPSVNLSQRIVRFDWQAIEDALEQEGRAG